MTVWCCEQEGKTRRELASKTLRLMERSVFCDRMVFVKAVHKAEHLSDVELGVYDTWFNPMLELTPQLVPEGFVYLKTDPETCRRRIALRSRDEEQSMSNGYLEMISDFHDSWFVDGSRPIQSDHNSGSLVLGSGIGTRSRLLPRAPPRPFCL